MARRQINPNYSRHNMTLEERLLHHSMPEPNSGCWLWTGAVVGGNNLDYGILWWRGTNHRAHRLSWSVFRGPLDPKMLVCHKCDVPSCINPDHLFLGTHDENMADRTRKGRQTTIRGEAHVNAKLTLAQVEEIRRAPGPQRVLAARFGVSGSAISLIRRGVNWNPGHQRARQ